MREAYGTLSIRCYDALSRKPLTRFYVYIGNSRIFSGDTSVLSVTLAPSTYSVKIWKELYKWADLNVSIKAGRTTIVSVTLSPLA